MTHTLFTSYQLGSLSLPNRAVMAPMTRNRARGTIQGAMNAVYYAQRASAGLIITEGTQVSELGQGYPDTPGIYTEEHVEGWRTVTRAVRAAGGRIFAQLWHVGRISHSCFHGQTPVAPSAIAPAGQAFTPDGLVPFETPRALTTEEIGGVVNEFRHAARCAKEAGFDGVEIHGANGYLIDQFLQSGTNQRTDEYGGSVENRTRFLLEVVQAVVEVWGADRVGVRLSPGRTFNDMFDERPLETFAYVARALQPFDLAYLHVVEAAISDGASEEPVSATELMRANYQGTLMSCGGYTSETAERALQEGKADLIAFGSSWLANPDLVLRFVLGARLNEPDRSTFYGGGEKGYNDYPILGLVQR